MGPLLGPIKKGSRPALKGMPGRLYFHAHLYTVQKHCAFKGAPVFGPAVPFYAMR